jgi:hypothetical protein
MDLKQFFVCFIIIAMVANSEGLKVIFARNTTAHEMRDADAERIQAERESRTDMSTIINVPTSCKPGFVFESTFHNRCRKVSG